MGGFWGLKVGGFSCSRLGVKILSNGFRIWNNFILKSLAEASLIVLALRLDKNSNSCGTLNAFGSISASACLVTSVGPKN